MMALMGKQRRGLLVSKEPEDVALDHWNGFFWP